jgi:hypothetical protein
MSEFEELYYKQEGIYVPMDPNEFYKDVVENVQKPSKDLSIPPKL